MLKFNIDMKKSEKNLKYFKEKLKNYNYFIYKLMSNKMNKPVVLLESLIDYFQYEIINKNTLLLNFNSLDNRAIIDLFVFAITSKKAIADTFYNNFISCLSLAFDQNNQKWDKDVVCEILVKNKYIKKYDLAAMSILINKSIDILKAYIVNLKQDNKTSNIPLNNIFDLFEMIANDDFIYQLCYLIQHNKYNYK